MITHALFVRLEAKPGKERAVEDFLTAGLEMTNREASTPICLPSSCRQQRSASSTPLPVKRTARHICTLAWPAF
jgi:hypothetical protein